MQKEQMDLVLKEQKNKQLMPWHPTHSILYFY